MKKAILFLIFFSLTGSLWSSNESYLIRLDKALVREKGVVAQKEKQISRLRMGFFLHQRVDSRLADCRQLVQEYLYFQYDSAKVYADRGIVLARQSGQTDYLDRKSTRLNSSHAN